MDVVILTFAKRRLFSRAMAEKNKLRCEVERREDMSLGRTQVFVAFMLAVSGLGAASQQQLTGVVNDSMCGARHMAKDKSPADCARMCVKQGMKYALVVGDKVYTLEGHETELDKLAGERATVKGNIIGETVGVESVSRGKKG